MNHNHKTLSFFKKRLSIDGLPIHIIMAKTITFFLFLFIAKLSAAQLMAGAAFGTFNVPGASQKFKGYGPTVNIDYTMGEEDDAQLFLDVSLYNKARNVYQTAMYDADNAFIGSAATNVNYSIKHIQLGFKKSMAGDFADSKFNYFLGGGAAFSFVTTTYKYSLAGYKFADDKVNRTLFGFHFNTGGQWIQKKFVLELKGNMDIMLKPVTIDGGDNTSNILTSLRLGILVPITKH